MKNIFDRLEKYMKINNLNPNKITVKASLSVGLLGKALKNRKSLNSETIEKILYAYSDLSPDWLLTGTGEMLKLEPQADVINMNNVANGSKNVSISNTTGLTAKGKEYKTETEFLKREIESLRNTIKDKEEIINLLKNK